ncbi:hypothetical protein [Salinicola avicenniae]|uniref:hypothetical protein n=1 Tax=Salinicola avicenniae TaxID=2916836 RepID=UPI00207389D5|nr:MULTISPECIES: hypothetical protein [unclassified Salinicola]
MIRVTLDLTCSVCHHDQFFLPLPDSDQRHVRCTRCMAVKCHTADLEKAMIALNREKRDAARVA